MHVISVTILTHVQASINPRAPCLGAARGIALAVAAVEVASPDLQSEFIR